jgi:CBS domain containing-hemolysin-like protein
VIFACLLVALWLALGLTLASLLQLLYQESGRLVRDDVRARDFFRDHVEDVLGRSPEEGVAAFGLLQQISLGALALDLLLLFQATAVAGWESILSASGALVVMVIVLCHLVPQTLYRKTECRWLVPLTPLLKILLLAVAPVLGLMRFVGKLSDLSAPEPGVEEPPTTGEQLEALIEVGAEEGIIPEDDRKLLQSAVSFMEKTVREVMTPRPNIVAIAQDKTLEELRELVVKEQYSRIPIYERNIDEIIGFVHVRDMFEVSEEQRKVRKVRELLRILQHVPETKAVDDLLREMQRDGAHMAIVVDEYGNTAGLATMEDLVEQIVGEIHDEHDPERDVKEESAGVFVVAGNFDVDRLEELVDFQAGEETASTTVGGLVSEWLGRVPTAGESIERPGIQIEVLAASELRVEQVRIRKQAIHVDQ